MKNQNSTVYFCPEHPEEKLLKEEYGPDEKTGFCLRCCKHYKLDDKSIK